MIESRTVHPAPRPGTFARYGSPRATSPWRSWSAASPSCAPMAL